MANSVGVLSSMTSMAQASDHQIISEFTSFSVQLRRQYPAIASVTRFVTVTHDDRAWFEADQCEEGLVGYTVLAWGTDGRGISAPSRDSYMPLAFVEPLSP